MKQIIIFCLFIFFHIAISQQQKIENQDDLEFDFMLNHVPYAGYHAATLQIVSNTEKPIWLLVAGSSYFIVDYIGRNSNLTRENVEISTMGHTNGIIQGMLLGASLVKESNESYTDTMNMDENNSYTKTKIMFGLGSIGGIGKSIYSYNLANELDAGQIALSHSYELNSLIWSGSILGITEVDFGENNEQIIPAIFFVTSASAPYWSNFLYEDKNLSLGDVYAINSFHTSSALTGISIAMLTSYKTTKDINGFYESKINPKIFFSSLLVSSVAGTILGTELNNNRGLLFEQGRSINRFTLGGILLGYGTFLVLHYDDDFNKALKYFPSYLAAGSWFGYLYANFREDETFFSSNLKMNFSPENILLTKTLDKFKTTHLPVFKLSYNF